MLGFGMESTIMDAGNAPSTTVHNFWWSTPFSAILVPLERWECQLSNGTKIVKNGVDHQKLWTVVDGAFPALKGLKFLHIFCRRCFAFLPRKNVLKYLLVFCRGFLPENANFIKSLLKILSRQKIKNSTVPRWSKTVSTTKSYERLLLHAFPLSFQRFWGVHQSAPLGGGPG